MSSAPPPFGSRLALRLALATLCLVVGAAKLPAWDSVGALKIPKYNYNFLAATPNGDLLAATFNSSAAGAAERPLPALLIRNPGEAKPEVVSLCLTPFEAQRGYSGIACDATGSFFVSGDTGNSATCFIRKFKADGSPDTAFGSGGEVRPARRCLGVDIAPDVLCVAVDWGEILLLDAKTGAAKGKVPKLPGTIYIRDIAMDPKSMRIFGVAQGAIYTWGGGTPWNPEAYRSRQVSEKAGELRAGEGLSIDPLQRTVLTTPIPGNQLVEVYGNGQRIAYTVTSAQPKTHLADSVLSFDGSMVFLSDMIGQQIHAMRRDVGSIIASRVTPTLVLNAAALSSATGTANALKWNPSYNAVVQETRQAGKPMIVYFRRPKVPRCEEFEKRVVLTPAFASSATNNDFVCVFQDAALDRLLAYRFGVYQVPHLVVLDAKGETKAEFGPDADPKAVYSAMQMTP